MFSVVSKWQKAYYLNKENHWYLKLEVIPFPAVFNFPALLPFLLREKEREESTSHAYQINQFIWFIFQNLAFGRTGEILDRDLNWNQALPGLPYDLESVVMPLIC